VRLYLNGNRTLIEKIWYCKKQLHQKLNTQPYCLARWCGYFVHESDQIEIFVFTIEFATARNSGSLTLDILFNRHDTFHWFYKKKPNSCGFSRVFFIDFVARLSFCAEWRSLSHCYKCPPAPESAG
jgi:hypothetical protein